MRWILLAITLSTAAPAAAQPFDPAAWRGDLRALATELPERHPDLFYRMSRAEWDSAVGSIEARLPTMTRNQAIVAFMELVALVRDGHTSINPAFDPALGIRYYPFELHSFEDGLYVRAAAPENAGLVGAKVVGFGRVTAEDAVAAMSRTIPHENEWWARAWAPRALGFVEIVDGLGLVEDMERLPLVVEREGRRDTVLVAPAGRLAPRGHDPRGPIDMSRWVDMRGPGEPPLWLQLPDRPYWGRYVPEERLLYVAYRGVVDAPHGPSNAEFWRNVFARIDSLPVERLVLDLRENTGGESFYNRRVVRGIVARPEIDRPDRLFVILGRKTFSAAMNLAQDLESWTEATFVGEPTGNATLFFGDHEQIRLPASGITVNVSTLPWHPDSPRDHRDYLAPDLYTPMTAADYRADVDPAMRTIRARWSEPSLSERVEAAVLADDVEAAERLVAAAAADPVHRFRSPEADVNALGYRLLRSDRIEPAVQVFRINAEVFPESANVWDSLGEALLAAGRREEAIESYRRALAIDPQFPSSVAALERLGVREAEAHPREESGA